MAGTRDYELETSRAEACDLISQLPLKEVAAFIPVLRRLVAELPGPDDRP